MQLKPSHHCMQANFIPDWTKNDYCSESINLKKLFVTMKIYQSVLTFIFERD